MKKWGAVLGILALMAMVCLPSTAMADITLSGGTGWHWGEPGSITFDQFDTYFTDGAQFSSALINGNAATIGWGGSLSGSGGDGWTGSYVSTNMSTASGTDTTTLKWDYNFLGDSLTQPITFDINYFLDGVFQLHEYYTFNNNTWTGGSDNNQVPLPPSAFLLGSGLLGIVGLSWRRRKTAA